MSQSSWDNKHPRRAIRPDALRATKRISVKSRYDKSVASAAATKSAVYKFEFVLHCLFIRRHKNILWCGKRLLDLLSIQNRVVRTKFPSKLQKAFQEEFAAWKADQNKILWEGIANCENKCAADPTLEKEFS